MEIESIEKCDWLLWQAIYEESFPIAERFDFKELVNLSKNNSKIHLSKLVEINKMLGILCHIDLPEQQGFILYFAIKKNQRGMGLGSKSLIAIKNLYPKGFILESELTGTKSSNEVQRQQRFDFYERNGIKDLNVISHNMGGDFHLMRSTTNISTNQYLEAVNMLDMKVTLDII